MSAIRLRNARIRLLVMDRVTKEFTHNLVLSRLRDAVNRAKQKSFQDSVAFIAINESIVGFYVNGRREESKPTEVPERLRLLPRERPSKQVTFDFGTTLSAAEIALIQREARTANLCAKAS